MEEIKKHIQSDDVQKLRSSTWYTEGFTCVQKPNDDKWTCIEGLYERFCGPTSEDNYYYKTIIATKLPSVLKKPVFEMMNKNHKLVNY